MTYSIYLALALATAGRDEPEDTAEATPDLPDVLEPALGRIRALVEGLRTSPLSPSAAAQFEKDLQQITRERLRDEWRLLGFVVGPPLMSLFRPRLPRHLITSRELPGLVGRRVHVAGVTATARHIVTPKGRPMQFVTLEDEWGLIEVTLFPGSAPQTPYLTLGPYLAPGSVEEHYGVLTVNASSFQRAPT